MAESLCVGRNFVPGICKLKTFKKTKKKPKNAKTYFLQRPRFLPALNLPSPNNIPFHNMPNLINQTVKRYEYSYEYGEPPEKTGTLRPAFQSTQRNRKSLIDRDH